MTLASSPSSRSSAHPDWSDRRIAGMVGRSHNTVVSVRDELEGCGQIDHIPPTERIGKDDKPSRARKDTDRPPDDPEEKEPKPETESLIVSLLGAISGSITLVFYLRFRRSAHRLCRLKHVMSSIEG